MNDKTTDSVMPDIINIFRTIAKQSTIGESNSPRVFRNIDPGKADEVVALSPALTTLLTYVVNVRNAFENLNDAIFEHDNMSLDAEYAQETLFTNLRIVNQQIDILEDAYNFSHKPVVE